MSRGVLGSTPGHGTTARYSARCRCTPCKATARRREARYRIDLLTGVAHTVPHAGTRRRLQALAAIGWSYTELAVRLGVDRTSVSHLTQPRPRAEITTARRVAALYDQLSMTPGPSPITKARAIASGWPPPLAWDDDLIDDPDATPADGAIREHVIDEVAVHRAAAGAHVDITPAERRAAVVLLATQGRNDIEIAAVLRVSPNTVFRHRRAANCESRYVA